MGRSEETEAHVQEALRLSPRDPFAMSWIATIGLANFYLGGDEEAVAWFRRSIEMFRNAPNAYFYLAAALVHLGRRDEAEAAVASGLAVNPAYSISGSGRVRSATNRGFSANASGSTTACEWRASRNNERRSLRRRVTVDVDRGRLAVAAVRIQMIQFGFGDETLYARDLSTVFLLSFWSRSSSLSVVIFARLNPDAGASLAAWEPAPEEGAAAAAE